jgi:predicted dehydrogenase
MDTKRLRVGVIGAGVGASHLAAYRENPNVEIVAVAGLEDDRVRRLAAEYGAERTYREYGDLIAAPDIDAVSVCVPNVLHAPVSIAALQAGKHVLVEKPLARTPEEGRAMIAAAREAGKVLMVSFNYRHRGDVRWLRQYITTGALGRIYYAKAYWMRRAGIPRLGSWFVSKEQAGGGPLIDLGVHVLDLAMHLMDEPRPLAVSGAVYAEFGPRGLKNWGSYHGGGFAGAAPYEVEDLGTAFIRLEGGATLTLEASWASHGSFGDDFGVILYGTEGGAELRVKNYGWQDTVRIYTDIDGVPVETTPFIPQSGGHRGVIDAFVAAALANNGSVEEAEAGLRRAEVIDAIYRSAVSGHEVVIEA